MKPISSLIPSQEEWSAKRESAKPSWPELDPLPELKVDKPQPFPYDGLGSVLGPAAREIADYVQVPIAMAAGSVLGVAAVACQGHINVELYHGAVVPVSLYLVEIAASGERKSHSDKVASLPLEEKRSQLARLHQSALIDFRKRRKDDKDITPPALQSIIVSRATVEGIGKLFAHQSHLGVFSNEAAEVLGGYSLNEERRSGSMAFYCKLWDGSPADNLTSGQGLSMSLNRRLSMHLMAQPVVASDLVGDEIAQGQGLLARILLSWPESLVGQRIFRDGEVPAGQRQEVIRYYQITRDLLNLPLPVHPEGDGHELRPETMKLTPEAREQLIQYGNLIEIQQAPEGPLSAIRPFASKAAEHAARISAIIARYEDPNTSVISAAALFGAIKVVDYFLGEHARILKVNVAKAHHGLLLKLLSWLRTEGPLIDNETLLQNTPNPVRKLKANAIKVLMRELAERGYVRQIGSYWEVRTLTGQ